MKIVLFCFWPISSLLAGGNAATNFLANGTTVSLLRPINMMHSLILGTRWIDSTVDGIGGGDVSGECWNNLNDEERLELESLRMFRTSFRSSRVLGLMLDSADGGSSGMIGL